MLNILKNLNCHGFRNQFININQQIGALFHTTGYLNKGGNSSHPSRGTPIKFLENNKVIFEPSLPNETPRPAVSF